jgi:hypothetical protein
MLTWYARCTSTTDWARSGSSRSMVSPYDTYELVWDDRRYPPGDPGTAYELATGHRLASGNFEGGKTGAVTSWEAGIHRPGHTAISHVEPADPPATWSLRERRRALATPRGLLSRRSIRPRRVENQRARHKALERLEQAWVFHGSRGRWAETPTERFSPQRRCRSVCSTWSRSDEDEREARRKHHRPKRPGGDPLRAGPLPVAYLPIGDIEQVC